MTAFNENVFPLSPSQQQQQGKAQLQPLREGKKILLWQKGRAQAPALISQRWSFMFWWWTQKTACHLTTFFGWPENPNHTQHGSLRWAERQSIELHDSVFVCHLRLMKQVGFSFNQYSCPLLLCKETDFTRTCSRNCELRHIFHSSSARQSCGWVGPSETLTKYVPASPEDKKTLSWGDKNTAIPTYRALLICENIILTIM